MTDKLTEGFYKIRETKWLLKLILNVVNIESYDREAREREAKELAAGMAAFALKTLTEINERYAKINGRKE